MEYNDTSNKNGILQRVERYAMLADGAITGDTTLKKQVTADVNEVVYELTTDIMLLQDSFDWDDPYKTDYPIATTPLVAGQRDYQFDSISFLKLKRVDITYDGINWKRAEAFDSASLGEGFGNEDLLDTEFNSENPKYDPKAFGFWLYPRATAEQVAAGAKARIEFSRGHTEYVYTDTTKEPPVDRPFQDLIAIGTALKWPNLPNDQYQKLLFDFNQGREKMVQHYAQRNEDTFLEFNSDNRRLYS